MIITRLAGGVCYATATIAESLRLIQAANPEPVFHYRTPRGWRVEFERDGQGFYLALMMDPQIHDMRSAYVNTETGVHFWDIYLGVLSPARGA
jgi:hypothetical protein